MIRAPWNDLRWLAAMESLRSLVQRFPANESYRMTLMMALSMNSDHPGAVAQAERILQLPGPNHVRHFNIAQVFWFAGDHQRAEQHYMEAYRLAADAQEKQDVIERLEYLRGAADG